LTTNATNWDIFQDYINHHINPAIRLKDHQDIERAVHDFTVLLQQAAWHSTPPLHPIPPETYLPLRIKELVQEKRRARRTWHHTRHPTDKRRLNNLTHGLHAAIKAFQNETFAYYIQNLDPNDCTLWKATKFLKKPKNASSPLKRPDGTWARTPNEKAAAYAVHLVQTFTTENTRPDADIQTLLDAPFQLSPPARSFTPAAVLEQISKITARKTPGHDLITADILKHLPRRAVTFITTLFNRILHLAYFPLQWKFAQILMIPKPGKPPTDVTSYRPISLLPLLSKIFERLLKHRILEIARSASLIPSHQFGFLKAHSTIHQCHRIVNTIREGLETKQICAAVFLDVKQAFDKVWHPGLLYKLKQHFPHHLYALLRSYLSQRYFDIKTNDSSPSYYPISSGVPQGSVLGPLLYLIYTADIPTKNTTIMATFADDTAILALDHDPRAAAAKLQEHLDALQSWLNRWRIHVNTDKSANINFTTRNIQTPPLLLNNDPIPQKKEVKYLGLHLDTKLTWRAHITAKKRQLNIQTRKLQWLIGRQSKLSLRNKIIIYKVILKPVWTYGIELWGCAKPSNTKILQNYQSKLLRTIAQAPWYVTNQTLHNDLSIPFISEVRRTQAARYTTRTRQHPNDLIHPLAGRHPAPRRLHRHWTEDLAA
jgi:hypothetical protein